MKQNLKAVRYYDDGFRFGILVKEDDKRGGTLYMLRPVSEMGEGWVKDNLPGDALTFGGAIAVEHRYIEPIVEGIINDGLTIA